MIEEEGIVVGSIEQIVENRMSGKKKEKLKKNVEDGENVIIINEEKVVMKGKKYKEKK